MIGDTTRLSERFQERIRELEAASAKNDGLNLQIAINYGYYRYQYATMVVAVILLIVLVQIFQSIGTALAKKLDKRLK